MIVIYASQPRIGNIYDLADRTHSALSGKHAVEPGLIYAIAPKAPPGRNARVANPLQFVDRLGVLAELRQIKPLLTGRTLLPTIRITEASDPMWRATCGRNVSILAKPIVVLAAEATSRNLSHAAIYLALLHSPTQS